MRKNSDRDLLVQKTVEKVRLFTLNLVNKDKIYLTAAEWLKVLNIVSEKTIAQLLSEEANTSSLHQALLTMEYETANTSMSSGKAEEKL